MAGNCSRQLTRPMLLSSKAESFISPVQALPPDEASKAFDWVFQLADLVYGCPVQWSDSWCDENLRNASAAAVRNFDNESRENSERWEIK
jgi:hypothetical protein